jgi:peptidylprolyl isomerase
MRLILALALACSLARAQETEEPAIQTTSSGLQYQVLKAGEKGTGPAPGDTASVHYTGWLKDGKKFDSSRDRGNPFAFVVGAGAVIEGWDEGLGLMTVGSRFKFTIPWKLAYGEEGRGPIPAKSDLIFDVELLGVEKGRPLPRFQPSDPERQKTTKSGLKYEILAAGEGDPPTETENVKLRFMCWTPEGRILFCTEQRGQFLTGPCNGFNLKFLGEAARLLRVGGKGRFEVPPALAFKDKSPHPKLAPNSVTIWMLELDEILRVPEFATTAADRLTKTASGLGYEVLREGSGARPGPRDKVRVHYTGWLESGKEFDSSHRRGQPAEFALDGVIKGWTEGLQLMQEGAAYRFTIPSDLAYGPRGNRGIPGGATLIFYVELVKVLK